MSITDEKIYNLRRKRQAEASLHDYDFSKRLFFIGWGLFLLLGILLGVSVGIATLRILIYTFGQPEELEQVAYAYIASFGNIGGFFFGQLIALIALSKIGKKWRGNLHFGNHPVFYISLASLISFNVCFFLLLTLVLSFSK